MSFLFLKAEKLAKVKDLGYEDTYEISSHQMGPIKLEAPLNLLLRRCK